MSAKSAALALAAWLRAQDDDALLAVLHARPVRDAAVRDMFDLADAFCRAERLLSLERSPRERAFHTWMLTEIVAQLEGEQSTTWEDVDPSSHTPQPVA